MSAEADTTVHEHLVVILNERLLSAAKSGDIPKLQVLRCVLRPIRALTDPGSHSEVADLGCRSCCDLAPMSRIETGAFGPVGRGTGVALASDVSRLLSAPVPFPLANAHSHSHVGRTFRSDNSNGSGLPVISLAQPSLSQLVNPCLERIDRTAALPAQGWTDSAHLSCTQV